MFSGWLERRRRPHLDVAVDDAELVQVGEAVGERRDDAVRLQLRQDGPPADVVVQLAAAQQLHHDEDALRGGAARGLRWAPRRSRSA